jgi:hypothetical protein
LHQSDAARTVGVVREDVDEERFAPEKFFAKAGEEAAVELGFEIKSADMLAMASASAVMLSPGSRSTCMWANEGRPSMVVFIYLSF